MKNICKYLFKSKWIILLSLIVSFLFGCTITHVYDYYNGYYQATFTVDDYNLFNENKEKLSDVSYLNKIKDSGYNEKTNTNKYENIDVESMLKHNGFALIEKENSFIIKTGYRYYDTFFILSTQKLSSRAKMFIKDSLTNLDENLIIKFDMPQEIIEVKNIHNKWLIGIYTTILGLILVISYLLIRYYKHKDIQKNQNYKIESQISSLKNAKSITTLAMLFALMLACKFIPLPSGFGNMGISFTYLFFSLIGLLYGPLITFGIGILSDVIGYFINGTGYFFLGYTLQAALTGAIYGFCFYKKYITFSKTFLARFLVNIFMNAILGSFLYAIVMTDLKIFSEEFLNVTMSYMILLSLPKNIVYLLPQSLLLFAFFKAINPMLFKLNYLKKVKLISENKSANDNMMM